MLPLSSQSPMANAHPSPPPSPTPSLDGQHSEHGPFSKWRQVLCGNLHPLIDPARPFPFDRYIACLISILLFCYTSTALTCLHYLDCVSVADASVVYAEPSIDCLSDEYAAVYPLVLAALIVYVAAFPIIIMIGLWRANKAGKLSLDAFKGRWGCIYAMYDHHAWMWQGVVLIRRFAFAIVAVLLLRQPAVQFFTYAVLHLISGHFHAMVRPYGHSSYLHRWESISYVLLELLSVMLTAYQPPYSDATQALILILIFPFVLGAMTTLIWRQWRNHCGQSSIDRALDSNEDGADDMMAVKPSFDATMHF